MSIRTRNTMSDDRGFTLTEMLVVTMLVTFVVGTGYFILNATMSMRDGIEARAVAATEARLMVDRFTLELRQAQEIVDGGGAFAIAEARRCQFYSDINRNGVPERVTYEVVDQRIERTQAKSLTEAPPYDEWGPESPPEILISSLKEDWTGEVFAYYRPGGDEATRNQDISAVELRVLSAATRGGREFHVDTSTWVKVRAVHSTID